MRRQLFALVVGPFLLAWLSVILVGQANISVPQDSRVTMSPPTDGSAIVTGTVVDNVGVVPGATVTATHVETGRPHATTTNGQGEFRIASLPPGRYTVQVEMDGFRPVTIPDVNLLGNDIRSLGRVTLTAGGISMAVTITAELTPMQTASASMTSTATQWTSSNQPSSGESYAHVDANRFERTSNKPLSTFGADVDTASYTNVRRFLSGGQLPPSDAVRVEEMLNYFRFGYAEPRGSQPLALTTEVGDCPWAPGHKLVLIGARAKARAVSQARGRNIVLLIDVSGSMQSAERLPLIKTGLRLFVDTLRPDDRLALVTYAGSTGVALPSTPANQRDVIHDAIAGLGAGGSTNGGQGLLLAYRVARDAYIPDGINRVILATDGDFNVGVVDQQDLLRLIEREKESGVFLSVFGVGSGNLKDSTMEMLADRGNGHYAYIDSLQEARRVLLREGDATLETVAKDVKFQVEFNPAMVSAWKLIGYENRALADRDFNDDRKDGGEMGAGHTVTVLYEVVPVGSALPDDGPQTTRPAIDPLKYQAQPQADRSAPAGRASHTGEWLTVKARYKQPNSDESDVIAQSVRSGERSEHLPFASAVAEFGLLLREPGDDAEQWNTLARRIDRLTVPASLAADKDGFGELVAMARGLRRLK